MKLFGKGKSPKISYQLLLDIEKFVAMGLSQVEIARTIGISGRTMRRWIANGRQGKGDVRYQHVAALFDGQDPPPVPKPVRDPPKRAKEPERRNFNDVLLDVVRRRREEPPAVETDFVRLSELGDEIRFEYNERGEIQRQTQRRRYLTADDSAIGQRWLDESEE